LVLSANNLIPQVATLSGKSLMYRTNSNVPKTEPCGTPLFIQTHWELVPFSSYYIPFANGHVENWKAVHLNICYPQYHTSLFYLIIFDEGPNQMLS